MDPQDRRFVLLSTSPISSNKKVLFCSNALLVGLYSGQYLKFYEAASISIGEEGRKMQQKRTLTLKDPNHNFYTDVSSWCFVNDSLHVWDLEYAEMLVFHASDSLSL